MILQRFVSFRISLIFRYCLFVEKKLVMIKHFLLNFFGGSKCVTKWQFLLILKIVKKDPFLRHQMRATLLKYVKSQRSYGFLITKEQIFVFGILDLKDHFSASLSCLKSGVDYS